MNKKGHTTRFRLTISGIELYNGGLAELCFRSSCSDLVPLTVAGNFSLARPESRASTKFDKATIVVKLSAQALGA